MYTYKLGTYFPSESNAFKEHRKMGGSYLYFSGLEYKRKNDSYSIKHYTESMWHHSERANEYIVKNYELQATNMEIIIWKIYDTFVV